MSGADPMVPERSAPMTGELRGGVHGLPPLPARLEPWMTDLLADPAACAALVAQFGSPVNVLDPAPLAHNAAELVAAGAAAGVDVRVFFARKANKSLGFVRAAAGWGHGVDVSSAAELRQVLDAGVAPDRVILSAAIKPAALIELAVGAGVIVSLDTRDELTAVDAAARRLGRRASVAPRVAPGVVAAAGAGVGASRPTRFGEPADAWAAVDWDGLVAEPVGVHAHVHGYAASDRVAALADCLIVADALAAAGRPCAFVDLGGGVPMRYLESAADWDAFWTAHRAARGTEDVAWRDHPLASVYPAWQHPVRGEWLAGLLSSALPGAVGGETAASALRRRGLRLHLEPGRSLVDGCGLTLASVAFTKRRSDGVGLVGLEMNRTQCRSAADDFLVDPLLVTTRGPGEAFDGFLVGAYCIEDELITLRRLRFPGGVAAGDLIAIPNTAGYQMHILESASHQIPLARNVIRQGPTLEPVEGPIPERVEGPTPERVEAPTPEPVEGPTPEPVEVPIPEPVEGTHRAFLLDEIDGGPAWR